jgi:hypothetical protein
LKATKQVIMREMHKYVTKERTTFKTGIKRGKIKFKINRWVIVIKSITSTKRLKVIRKVIKLNVKIYIKLDTLGGDNIEGALYSGKRGEGVQSTLRTPQYKCITRPGTSKIKVSGSYIIVNRNSFMYEFSDVKGNVKKFSRKRLAQWNFSFKKPRKKQVTCSVIHNYSFHFVLLKVSKKLDFSISCKCGKNENIVDKFSDVKGNVQNFIDNRLTQFNLSYKQKCTKQLTCGAIYTYLVMLHGVNIISEKSILK